MEEKEKDVVEFHIRIFGKKCRASRFSTAPKSGIHLSGSSRFRCLTTQTAIGSTVRVTFAVHARVSFFYVSLIVIGFVVADQSFRHGTPLHPKQRRCWYELICVFAVSRRGQCYR